METIFDEFNRPRRNYRTGQYLAGHKPFNAGVPWTEWMPEELRASVLSNLEKGRKRKGEPAPCAGWNARKVVLLDGSGIPHFYSSASAAGRMLHIQCRNIISCCQGKRKHAGGITFFYEDDPRWVEHYRLHGFDNQKNDL